MMEDFAERRGINLIVMHGNRKICHEVGGSEKFLAYVQWDSHAYFLRSARPVLDRPVDQDRVGEETRVVMDRDQAAAAPEWEWWDGTQRAGNFISSRNLAAVRQEWMEEGVVPIANPCGVGRFSSIQRCVDDGMLKLKAAPQFFSELREVMAELRCSYKL